MLKTRLFVQSGHLRTLRCLGNPAISAAGRRQYHAELEALRGSFLPLDSAEKPRSSGLKPVYNMKHLKQHYQEYVDSVNRRGINPRSIGALDVAPRLLELEKTMKKAGDLLVHQRRLVEQKFRQLDTPEDRENARNEMKQLKTAIQSWRKDFELVQSQLSHIVAQLPNLIDSGVPDSEPHVVKYLNGGSAELKDNPGTPGTSARDHRDIGVEFGLMDFERAAVASGSSWYYLIGDGALLEQALVQYALSKARAAGFRPVVPPSIVRTEVGRSCGYRPKDQNNERQYYELYDRDLCLTGTAEIPLAALYANRTLREAQLPQKLVGVSRSYRAEAGATGRDTRGLYRVHEFTKVELFVWENGVEKSRKVLEELRELQESILGDLEIPCRVLCMPANDLGSPAFRKYDIEAWMPGRGSWGELSSASNCTDYQSRRLNTRVESEDGKLEFAHTLNGTAMAVPRVIVALIENGYDAERQTIRVPKVLQAYMDGKTEIHPQQVL